MNERPPQAPTAETPPPIRIGDWLIEPDTGRLTRNNQTVKLEPKVMELLVYLAQRPGRVVPRDELEQKIWAGTVVGYDALTSSVIKLRKALGDDSRHPQFIETVSKKGYRLIAPVGAVSPDAEAPIPAATPLPATPSRRWRAAAAAIAFAVLAAGGAVYVFRDHTPALPEVRDRPAIAVLPFGNLGNDPAQAYLSEGITADITTAISKLSGLYVVASASARNVQSTPGDVKQVAESLGVRYVLDGNVRRTGSRLRVNVQLVDAVSGFQIWAERYDREMQEVLDVQDDITTKIANALSVKLTETEKQRTARRYTADIAAYDEFLRGQSLYVRATAEDNLQARAHFQQAIDRDPGFARAHGALALTYADEFRFGWGRDPAEALKQALDEANKAVALDDQLPQAYRALSYVQLHRREYRRSIDAIQRAIALDPNDADAYASLAFSRVFEGDYETAIRMLREVMQRNPRYPARYGSALGHAYYFHGQYEQAVATLRDTIDRNASLLSSHILYTAALSQLGRKDESAWAAAQVRALSPGFSVEQLSRIFPIKDPAKLRALTDDLKRAGL